MSKGVETFPSYKKERTFTTAWWIYPAKKEGIDTVRSGDAKGYFDSMYKAIDWCKRAEMDNYIIEYSAYIPENLGWVGLGQFVTSCDKEVPSE